MDLLWAMHDVRSVALALQHREEVVVADAVGV